MICYTEDSDSDSPVATPAAPAAKKPVPVKSKWDGEDEEDDGPVVCDPKCLDYRAH